MTPQSRIYVAGHCGMVGAAIIRTLQQQGQTHIVTRTHAELDLTSQAAVQAFFETAKKHDLNPAPPTYLPVISFLN